MIGLRLGECVFERFMLLANRFDIAIDSPAHDGHAEGDVIPRPELLSQPSHARQLFPRRGFVARHHPKGSADTKSTRLGDCTAQSGVLGRAVAIRDVERVNILSPWAKLALLTRASSFRHDRAFQFQQ